ncbi:MAG: type I-E CRISPR-associated protein Cas7/Cse4/CasC [Firmicutes bacterium]|nr:type I-E CRISPR-associated protein Cas7/Cse4/CasC [Bacillota bacterium]
MKQPVLFGKPEADYFVGLLREAAQKGDEDAARAWLDETLKKSKANFKALLQQAGIEEPAAGFEGALFGRFVTSDILARVDAPVHVAHSFTTHALDTEVDYFTVVDDLAEDETGAAHANEMELGGGVYYGYIVVDIPLLISNLTGCDITEWESQDKQDAYDLLSLLIHAAAQVTPGAKLGATAPYARAECVVLEVGAAQPRSLANAFLKPVSVKDNHATIMNLSISALGNYISALESMYGKDDTQRFVAITPHNSWPRTEERVVSLQEAVDSSLRLSLGDEV